MKTDPRFEQYISKAEPFAPPILTEIRKRVHEACPDLVEDMKWSFPHFMYKGKILCSMASFKKHCAFGFWLAALMKNDHFKLGAMGDLGKMSTLSDLPSESDFMASVLEAMNLIDSGQTISKPSKKLTSFPESEILLEALKNNPQAAEIFFKFAPSQQKEYHQWILEAKTEATALKRLETAVEWISEGKIRHWKYAKC